VINDIQESYVYDWADADALAATAHDILHSPLALAQRKKACAAATAHRETAKAHSKAIRLSRQITNRLWKKKRKQGLTDREHTLIEALSTCRPKKPCTSAACPKCTFTFREVITNLHSDLRSHGIKLDGCLTVIGNETISTAARKKGKTETALSIIDNFIGDLSEAFDEACITIVIGAIDISWQESRDNEFPAHARPHLHALVLSSEVSRGRSSLNKYFRSSDLVTRPVQLDPYDGSAQWLRYLLKYPDQRAIRTRNHKGNWLPASYKSPTVDQQSLQAEILHGIGWGKRMLLRGVEIQKIAVEFRLVLTEFSPAPKRRHR
jgi:hypothetical protein